MARALVTEPALLLADEPTGNLDSRVHRRRPRAVFDQLSAAGRTIVLITHEPEVGARPKRLIRLLDGRVVSDVRQSAVDHDPVGAAAGRHPMSLFEIVRFALRGLAANKLRSGADHARHPDRCRRGDPAGRGRQRLGPGDQRPDRGARHQHLTVIEHRPGRRPASTALTTKIADALPTRRWRPTCSRCRRWSTTSTTLTYEGADHAVASSSAPRRPGSPRPTRRSAGGAAFTADDEAQGRRVVVIGQTVAEELFAGVDPIGKQVTVGGALFTVVGVLGGEVLAPASRTPTTPRSPR